MNIAVVGSRTMEDYDGVERALDNLLSEKDKIITGDAKGADSLAIKYAMQNKMKFTSHKAEWDKHGKKAGFIRNQYIVDDSEYIVAFWDGKSRGTKDTLNKAYKKKKPVLIFWI